jgi:hypothetical protein
MTGIKLEVGKRYVRRDGTLSGKLEAEEHSVLGYEFVDFDEPYGPWFYRANGRLYTSDISDLDLVSEHVEPAPGAGVGLPAGWKLVPIEPTPEMASATWGYVTRALVEEADDADMIPLLRAAIAASPPHPSDPVVQKLVEALKLGAYYAEAFGALVETESERPGDLDEDIATIDAALALVGEVG